MEKVIYFDICAFFLMVILLFSTIWRKMIHGKENRYFLYTLICTFLTIIVDIWALVIDNMAGEFLVQKYISHSLYLLIHSITVPVYIAYIVSLTDTWHLLKASLLSKFILALPYAIILVSVIANTNNKKVFYLDENLRYTRGPWFPIIYISGFIYAAYGVYYIFHYKELFKKTRFWALMSVFIMVMGATIFQMFMPHLPVEMFATSIGLLFIAMFVQKPEENIEIVTGLHNKNIYASNIKRNYTNDKVFDIILINVANFTSVRDILGYDKMNTLLLDLANRFKEIGKKFKLKSDLYYLDNGKFRFVIEEKYRHLTEDVANHINETLSSGIIVHHMNINLINQVCVCKCPYDVADFEILMHFGEQFSKDYDYTGEVLFARDLFKKERYDLFNKLDSIIENAITNRKFQVYYQPIYSIKEQRFNSAEALLRLKDDDFGFIPPDVFIPNAEKSGAIHRIGAYVLEEVCEFIASPDFNKLNIDYIEINLSTSQCMHPDLVSQVLGTLKKYKISPDKINLEITETAAANAQSIMADNLEKLTSAGINFSLDDFGTGYSNMQRVASLPLKMVKLDRTFVNHEDNPKLFIVLENTIKMIKDMEMEIVAEGIETETLVQRFSDMKCEYIQGYYYSKPIPKNDFIAFITKNITEENA